MDHELKQRLIGAVVVTALAAIFVPMLFDDPVENSSQLVTEQTIPVPPVNTESNIANKVPASAEQVLASPEPNENEASAVLSDEVDDSQIKPTNSEDALYAETPGYAEDSSEPSSVDEPVIKATKPAKASSDTPVASVAAQDQAIKKAIKTKAPAVASEQEPFKKTQPSKLQQDALVSQAKKSVPAKKPDSQSVPKEASKQTNPAKTIAAAVADAKKPELAAKPGAPVRWYIQVGSFSKKENATSLWEGLRAQGLPASLDTVQTNKGTTYRLRVGPELDGKKAAAMKAKLDKQNINSILVSEQP